MTEDSNLVEDDIGPAPVDLKRITDGKSFIAEVNQEALPELHECKTSRGEVLVREVGHDVANQILVGQYRRSADGKDEMDVLSTADKAFCMAIQLCVVSENGEPLWKPAEIRNMFSGPKAPLFRVFLEEVYDAVVQWNPHLHPAGNQTALRRLMRWF